MEVVGSRMGLSPHPDPFFRTGRGSGMGLTQSLWFGSGPSESSGFHSRKRVASTGGSSNFINPFFVDSCRSTSESDGGFAQGYQTKETNTTGLGLA